MCVQRGADLVTHFFTSLDGIALASYAHTHEAAHDLIIGVLSLSLCGWLFLPPPAALPPFLQQLGSLPINPCMRGVCVCSLTLYYFRNV